MTFWSALENTNGLKETMPVWQERCGLDSSPLENLGLIQEGKATAVRCKAGCGARHEVVELSDKSLRAVCKAQEWEEFAVAEADIQLWRLDLRVLGRKIRDALQFTWKFCELQVKGVWQIGEIGGGGPPVLLSVQHDARAFHESAEQLVALLPDAFILLAPTSQFYNLREEIFLNSAKAGFFSLEKCCKVHHDGTLFAQTKAHELFARHLPEKREALEAEDLVAFSVTREKLNNKGFTEKGKPKKARPAVVFELLVKQGKSATEVAKACSCMKSLITLRQREIRDLFHGKTIAELRRLASKAKDLESSVKADRLSKKKQGAPVDDGGESKNGDKFCPDELDDD